MSQQRPPGPFFIAMSGKKQVGKDTATRMAVEHLEKAGLKVAVTAFAESLKEMCIRILGLEQAYVYGTNEEKDSETLLVWDFLPLDIRLKYSNETFDGEPVPRLGSMTIREVLQVVGTDIFREMLEPDVWANAPFRRDWEDCDVVILTDCRFPNEKRVTEDHGGVIIRLERDTGFVDNHPSEIALDDVEFDIMYENTGTLEELESFVLATLDSLGLLDGKQLPTNG